MIRTRAAVVVAAVAAAMACTAVAPASAAGAPSAAPKCKKGKVLVKTGRKKRCVKLRVAPPAPKAADRGRLALDFVLSPKWPALRDRRGRRVPSLAKRLRRTGHRAGPALRRTFARGLALVAARRGSVPAAAAARVGPHARAAQAGDGGVIGVSDGNTIGFNGEIEAGDVTIFVEFRAGLASDRIEGEDCPTGAGRLEGRKRGRASISIRLVGPGRRLISGYSATLAEENTYRGQTADDAKIDTLTIDHDGIVRTTVTGAGHAPLTLRMVTSRRAQVNMRSRTYTAGERRLDVQVRLTGAPADVAGLLEAQVARKLQGETDREFAEVVYTAMVEYRQMEERFNQDFNRCVAMRFDPKPDERRYFAGDRGRFKAWLEPTLDRGTRPNGIYRRKNQLNVEGSPTEATTRRRSSRSRVTAQQPGVGPVPRDVEGGRRGRQPGRAHAGRAVPTRPSAWPTPTDVAPTASLPCGCAFASSQDNTTAFRTRASRSTAG